MKKDISRVNAASKNIKTSVAGIFLNFLISFLSRKIFILVLGKEFAGFGSLVGNISALFTLLDFGAAGAVSYRLYEPLAKKDFDKVSQLLSFYSKISRFSGALIFVAGLFVLPAVPRFSGNFTDKQTLFAAFFMYVLSLSASYVFARERMLLFADQKNYINVLFGYAASAVEVVAECAVLVFFKSYILYIAVHIVITFIEDIIVAVFVRKSYPEISFKNKKIGRETRKELFFEMVQLQPKEISATLLRTADNFFVVSLFGVAANGMYSNYNMLLGYASMISVSLIGTITASVGNLNAQSSQKNRIRVFEMTDFLSFFMVNVCACILFVLSGNIVTLWLGKANVLKKSVSVCLAASFFISGTRSSVAIFRDACGLYKKEKLKSFSELLMTLFLEFFLGKKFGIAGIYLGQALSAFFVCWWYEPYVLFKYGFSCSPADFYLKRLSYFAVFVISCFVSDGICRHVEDFLLKLLVCIVLPSALSLFVFCRSSSFLNLLAVARKSLFSRT